MLCFPACTVFSPFFLHSQEEASDLLCNSHPQIFSASQMCQSHQNKYTHWCENEGLPISGWRGPCWFSRANILLELSGFLHCHLVIDQIFVFQISPDVYFLATTTPSLSMIEKTITMFSIWGCLWRSQLVCNPTACLLANESHYNQMTPVLHSDRLLSRIQSAILKLYKDRHPGSSRIISFKSNLPSLYGLSMDTEVWGGGRAGGQDPMIPTYFLTSCTLNSFPPGI